MPCLPRFYSNSTILKDLATHDSKCLHGCEENHGGLQQIVSTTVNTLEHAMPKFSKYVAWDRTLWVTLVNISLKNVHVLKISMGTHLES